MTAMINSNGYHMVSIQAQKTWLLWTSLLLPIDIELAVNAFTVTPKR